MFPLPQNAAVDRLKIHVGDRVIEGQIKERQQARKIYQQVKKSAQKSALVEQQRPNMFTTSVANISVGETVVVEIEYQQILEYDNGRFSLQFPMTITPRDGPQYGPQYGHGVAQMDKQQAIHGYGLPQGATDARLHLLPGCLAILSFSSWRFG